MFVIFVNNLNAHRLYKGFLTEPYEFAIIFIANNNRLILLNLNILLTKFINKGKMCVIIVIDVKFNVF